MPWLSGCINLFLARQLIELRMHIKIKEILYQACCNQVEKRMSTIEETIQSHQASLESETKSSAGDKHETGRAMLQLEMEKAGQQLASAQQMKETLAKINIEENATIIRLGSMVYTSMGIFFLSVSVGQIQVDGIGYFAISTSSPIGKLMLGKRDGDSFAWNGKEIQIHKVY